jgi:uncharacterized protein YheU (UPF0270 family)
MEIPWQQLDPDTLTNILESFVLREGTDYGEVEKSLAQKVADVQAQLVRNEVALVYSELHETLTIVPRQGR